MKITRSVYVIDICKKGTSFSIDYQRSIPAVNEKKIIKRTILIL
jgi:hypothetical protein